MTTPVSHKSIQSSAVMAACALAIFWFASALGISAQRTLITLHQFGGSSQHDGGYSYAPVIEDSAGNLYGTTAGGGDFNNGTVFRIDAAGNETVLYSFTGGTDGGDPHGGLLLDTAGNLYGITAFGGEGGGSGQGVIFKLDPSGVETVLHALTTGEGSASASGLMVDPSGNFFGTTESGGANSEGVVFKFDTSGNYTVLHSFGGRGVIDGNQPFAGLVRDAAGNIYGTTIFGGRYGFGTVFKIDVSGNESVLYSFRGGPNDGLYPSSSLLLDRAGNLYGTTDAGGTNNLGTVFKLSANGKAEKILHNFGSSGDGASPFVGLVKDSAGNFYGVTDGGGAFHHGTVFKIDGAGNESVLYSFTGSGDGARPEAPLMLDAAGNLFGTTLDRGSGHDAGTVFKLSAP